MKKYRTYTAKKYKLARRIIFYVSAAVIILVLTVIWGNHLNDKVNSVDRTTTDILSETEPPKAPDKENENGFEAEHDSALSSVAAGCLQLSGEDSSESAVKKVQAIKLAGFNAVSFSLTDEEGSVTYRSPALTSLSRLPASEKLVSFEALSAAFKAAGDMGLRISVVINSSESLADTVIAREVATLGAEEIVILGFEGYSLLNNDAVDVIGAYVGKMREAAGESVALSVCFTEEFYKAPQNAPYLEKVYALCEFLSIDMTLADAESAKQTAADLAGSFSAYLLRPLLSGDDKEAAGEISAALSEMSVGARQYVSSAEKKADED